MTLPASGAITIAQIKTEFVGPNYNLSTYYHNGGYITNNPANSRIPNGPATPIWLSNFHGAHRSTPGAWDQWSTGTYGLNIPDHQWIRLRVWGAGGGGANQYLSGGTGGYSQVAGYLVAYGGTGGDWHTVYAPGGTASGGNQQNLSGSPAWADSVFYNGRNGGAGANGGAGGLAGSPNGANGSAPGGGGGATNNYYGGGGGAFAHSYYGPGAALSLTVVVGTGGFGANANGQIAGRGAHGRVLIEWG